MESWHYTHANCKGCVKDSIPNEKIPTYQDVKTHVITIQFRCEYLFYSLNAQSNLCIQMQIQVDPQWGLLKDAILDVDSPIVRKLWEVKTHVLLGPISALRPQHLWALRATNTSICLVTIWWGKDYTINLLVNFDAGNAGYLTVTSQAVAQHHLHSEQCLVACTVGIASTVCNARKGVTHPHS